MIEKNLIKKIVDHARHPGRKVFIDNNIMHPERDWVIGLFAGLIICGAGAWWSAYYYLMYSNVNVSSSNEVSNPVIYRGSIAKEAISDFSSREKTYNDLADSFKGVVIENVTEATSTKSINSTSTESVVDLESTVETSDLGTQAVISEGVYVSTSTEGEGVIGE
jgi:hypothetical protein